ARLSSNYALPLRTGYPLLSRFLADPRSIDSRQAAYLTHEANELAFRLKAAEAMSQPEKDLIHVEHDLALLVRVADLQATEQEVREFAPRLNQFVALAKALLGSGFDETNVRQLISSSIDYYVVAL